MNMDRGIGFIAGLLLGGIVGAASALLVAPVSGDQARAQIRSEGLALKQRGQDFGEDTIEQAQKIVKQGQQNVAHTQTRLGEALDDQKNNLRHAVGVGK